LTWGPPIESTEVPLLWAAAAAVAAGSLCGPPIESVTVDGSCDDEGIVAVASEAGAARLASAGEPVATAPP
jgi:hypothetical protein